MKWDPVSFVDVDVMRLLIVFLFSIALMLNMSIVGVISMLILRLRMIIFQ